MKIELLTDSYSNAQGFKLSGKGIHDVSPDKAKYLLARFPDWFQAVDQDTSDEADQDVESSPLDVGTDPQEGEGAVAADEQTSSDQAEPVADEQGETSEATGTVEPENATVPADEQTEESVAAPVEGAVAETGAPEGTQEEGDEPAPVKSLSKMNKTELQALAAEVSAEVSEDMTADQMREAIKAAQETK